MAAETNSETAPAATSPAESKPKNKSGNRRGMHANRKIGGKAKGAKQPHLSGDLKDLRGELMLTRHITGEAIGSIAKDFGVSHPTAANAISDAKRSELYQNARDYLGVHLLPEALRVIEAAVRGGDLDAAFKVTDGLGITGTKADSWDGGAARSAANETFESFRLELIRRRAGGSADVQSAADQRDGKARASRPPSPIIDAEVVEASTRE